MRTRSSAAAAKAAWMAAFEQAVLALEAKHAGQIVWADATHLFNSAYTPAQAAERYVAAQKVSRNL